MSISERSRSITLKPTRARKSRACDVDSLCCPGRDAGARRTRRSSGTPQGPKIVAPRRHALQGARPDASSRSARRSLTETGAWPRAVRVKWRTNGPRKFIAGPGREHREDREGPQVDPCLGARRDAELSYRRPWVIMVDSAAVDAGKQRSSGSKRPFWLRPTSSSATSARPGISSPGGHTACGRSARRRRHAGPPKGNWLIRRRLLYAPPRPPTFVRQAVRGNSGRRGAHGARALCALRRWAAARREPHAALRDRVAELRALLWFEEASTAVDLEGGSLHDVAPTP